MATLPNITDTKCLVCDVPSAVPSFGNPRKRSHADFSQTTFMDLDSVPVLPKASIEGLAIKVSDVQYGKPPVRMWPNYVDHVTGMWIGGDVSVDLGSESARARVWWLRWCAVKNTDESNAFRYYGKFKGAMLKEYESIFGEEPDTPSLPTQGVLDKSYGNVRLQEDTWEGHIMRASRKTAAVREKKSHKDRSKNFTVKNSNDGKTDEEKEVDRRSKIVYARKYRADGRAKRTNTFENAVSLFRNERDDHGGNMTSRDLECFWKSTCRYCGGSPDEESVCSYRTDRVSPLGGYNIGTQNLNVVPCCSACNLMKKSYFVHSFVDACMTIDEHANQKIMPFKEYKAVVESTDVTVFLSNTNTGSFQTFEQKIEKCKEKGLECDMTKKNFEEISLLGCHYCGRKGPSGIDRIDSSIGHMKHNILPCCTSCNCMKNKMSYGAFLEHSSKVSKHVSKYPFDFMDFSTYWQSCQVYGSHKSPNRKIMRLRDYQRDQGLVLPSEKLSDLLQI
jgi:hypothetical protein